MSDKVKKALMKDFQLIKQLENDYPMLAASPFILEHKENYDKLRSKLKALEKAMLFGEDDPTGPGDEVEKEKTQEVISIKNVATFKQVYTKWANKIINDLAKYVGNEEVIDYALIVDSIGLLAGDDNVFTKNLFSEILAEVEKVNPPVLSKLVSILRQLFNKYKNLSDKELAALLKQNKKALKADAAGAFLNDLNSFNIVELIENALAKKGKATSNKLTEETQKEIETNVSYFNDWYSKNLGSLIEIEQNLSANLSEDACVKADAVKNFKGTIATLYSNLSCNNLGELIVENINNDNILSILKTIIANYSSISNFSLEDKAAIGKMYNLNRGANTLGLIFEQFIQAKIKDAQKIAFTNGLNVDANVKGQMDVKNSGNIGVKLINEENNPKPNFKGKTQLIKLYDKSNNNVYILEFDLIPVSYQQLEYKGSGLKINQAHLQILASSIESADKIKPQIKIDYNRTIADGSDGSVYAISESHITIMLQGVISTVQGYNITNPTSESTSGWGLNASGEFNIKAVKVTAGGNYHSSSTKKEQVESDSKSVTINTNKTLIINMKVLVETRVINGEVKLKGILVESLTNTFIPDDTPLDLKFSIQK